MSQSGWRVVRIYAPIRDVVRRWPTEIKKELGAVLTRLQKGESIGMPDVRPMPDVESGAAEIRITDPNGTFRTFHVIHSEHGILVFHAFTKKTRRTPSREIKVGRARLREFLRELEDEHA